MQNEEKLKETIKQYAELNTSVDFTNLVMARVEAAASVSTKTSLLRQKPLQIAMIAFVVIGFALFLVSGFAKPFSLPSLSLDLTQAMPYCTRVIYFVIIFWMVMLANNIWNKRMAGYQASSDF